jgi:pimeloyl-ACP methyl ester carboxylesterase
VISKTIEHAGTRLHYADFGGQGPTIVLVHGLGGSHQNWLAVAPGLARRGRVLALDLPGFGRSQRSPRRTTLAVMGDALARFLDAMSTAPVHLVGNSMGGTLVILEALERPERVASALLVCPALPPPPGGAHVDPGWMRTLLIACVPGGHVLLRREAKRIGPERHIRDLLALCCVDVTKVPREIVEAHVALTVERASTPWVERVFAEAARSIFGQLMFGRRLRRALRQAGPRTLIIQGQRDRLVDPRSARVAAAANASIELTELADLGHVPQLEAPDAFLEIAHRWLDRVGPATSRDTAERRESA